MTADRTPNRRTAPADDRFLSTRWSVVLAAGNASQPNSREALSELCRTYWYPLYAYARRRTSSVHEAQDLIQEFFVRLLEQNTIAVADQQRGRFRTFLLSSLRNFLANEWAKLHAEKRGGGCRIWQLDVSSAESRFAHQPTDSLTPDKLFDRRWAETLLDQAMNQLRDEFVRLGKLAHFDLLKPFLAGGKRDVSYANAARQLGISEGAAMVAAHRMRRRFRDLLRAEIAQTVATGDDVDDEIRDLFAALRPS